MIEIQQGTPGSGKSAVAVARAILHLRKGGVVAANFSLVDGWAMQFAKRLVLSYLPFGWGSDYAFKRASELHNRFFRVDSLDAIRAINPRQLATGIYRQSFAADRRLGVCWIGPVHFPAIRPPAAHHNELSLMWSVQRSAFDHLRSAHAAEVFGP